MKKKISLLLIIGLVSIQLFGCDCKNETIKINGKDDLIFDDINLKLKEGYFVQDYDIEYDKENGKCEIILHAYNEM